MNYLTYKNRLENQMNSFIDYLRYCEGSDLTKLLDEITVLRNRISELKEMTDSEANEQVKTITVTIESSMKFQTKLYEK